MPIKVRTHLLRVHSTIAKNELQAASDKIIREIEMFGENFENYKPSVDDNPPAPTAVGLASGPPKAADKAKKGKVAAKATGLQYQFQIMESVGIQREEIKKFADPYYWLKFFPPIAKVHIFIKPPTTQVPKPLV